MERGLLKPREARPRIRKIIAFVILALFFEGRDCYAKPVSPQVASTQLSVSEEFLQSFPKENCHWTSEIKDEKHLKLMLERYVLSFRHARRLCGFYKLDILDFYTETEMSKLQQYRNLQRTMLEVSNLHEHLEAVIGSEQMHLLQSKLASEFRTAQLKVEKELAKGDRSFSAIDPKNRYGPPQPPAYVGDFDQRDSPAAHPWDMKRKSPIPTIGRP